MMFKALFKHNSPLLRIRSTLLQTQRQVVLPYRLFTTDNKEGEQEGSIQKTDDQKQMQKPQSQSKMFQKKAKPQQQQQQQQQPKRREQTEQRGDREKEVKEEVEGENTQAEREQHPTKYQQLQTIVEKYKQKKEWNIQDIDKFVEEISGKAGIPKTKQINHQALAGIREKDWEYNARFSLDFGRASDNFKEFNEAMKGEPLKWQRDKFDLGFLRSTQKYLLSLKNQGITKLDANVFKDLNQITRKYLDMLGSMEFNTYMQNVLNTKLHLDFNNHFQYFITDLMYNSTDISTTGRIRSVVLERFIFLILQLDNPSFYKDFDEVKQMFLQEIEYTYNIKDRAQIFKLIEDPEYMLKMNLLSLSKNHNYFGQIDQYMKEFSRIVLSVNDKNMVQKLENALNTEIVFFNKDQDIANDLKYKEQEHEIHHGVLAQPQFQFLPKAFKLQRIQHYQKLMKELDKTREIKDLLEFAKDDTQLYLRLLSSSKEFFSLLNEIQKDEEQDSGVFDKLEKTNASMNEMVNKIFLDRYGISGIRLDNIEQIYNPLISGIGSITETRKYLISYGMSSQFADQLARQYIQNLERGQIHNIMDIFNSKQDESKALNLLMKSNVEEIALNYVTYDQYQKQVGQKEIEEKVRIMMQYKSILQQPKQARGFSTNNKQTKEQQKEAMYAEQYQDKSQAPGKSKFFDFIKKIDEIDQAKVAEQKESKADYDITDLDFSFEKVSKIQDLKTSKPLEQQQESAEIKLEPLTEQQQNELKLRNAREKLIFDAKKKYNYNFFKNFAFSGPDSMTLTQKSLEEYTVNIDSPQDIQLLIISLVNSAYELNALIPNVELLFYKIFCSPISTKEEREGRDIEDPLFGNIFAKKQVGMTYFGYKSLLETLILHPKKKHFKKIAQHMMEYESKEQIDSSLINMLVQLGIDQRWPVQLGRVMKHFITNDYNVPVNAFQDFILFLERCKGFEEDAKRFIFIISDTEHLDFSYKLIRPIILRVIKTKSGNEILKMFEQFRKNIRLNRASRDLTPQEKSEALSYKKKDFYDGLLQDLITSQAFGLAQIIYSEKMREKFAVTVNDNLIGLEIFAQQLKIDEFSDLFNKILSDKEKIELNQQTAESIAKNLMLFDMEKDKYRRIEMAEKLQKKIIENNVQLSGQLLDSLVFIYTESQQWKSVIELLYQCNPKNSQPEIKTLNYLKKNLLYCFETHTRAQLKEAIEKFEDDFFARGSGAKEFTIEAGKDRSMKVTKRERPRGQIQSE